MPTLLVGDVDAAEFAGRVGDEFRLITVPSVPDVAPVIERHGFGLTFASGVHSELLQEIRRILCRCPDTHLVVVIEHPTSLGEPCAIPPDVVLLSLHDGALRLRQAVRHGWFEGRSRLVARSLRAGDLPPALTGALRVLLRQRIPSALNDPPPLRTIQDLADAVEASRPYLSATATANGIPLASLAARWTAILALEHRLTSGLSWERIAWRCGYSGVPGLSELFRRKFGYRLRAARRNSALMEELDRFCSTIRDEPPCAPLTENRCSRDSQEAEEVSRGIA